MVIAVNTVFLLEELEGDGYFCELFQTLAEKHPEHQFYFLVDRSFKHENVFSSNVHPLIVASPARHPVLWKYWCNIKIPATLKKIKAEVFVSPDSSCSLKTKIPQCMVIHHLAFLHQREGFKKWQIRFFKKNTPKFLKKANRIITPSQFLKEEIVRHHKTNPGKIEVICNGVKEIFHRLTLSEKNVVKEKYTDGKEYFIYAGTIPSGKNLVSLLKAFTLFKKRLQSNMKLVIAERIARKKEIFFDLVNTYKYKADVILTGYLPEQERALVIGSAYALVHPALFEDFVLPVAEAIKCEVPALASGTAPVQEVAGEAALYFNPNDHIDIADKMMLIYKDENLRKQLIEKGKLIAVKYDWEKCAALFWESILKAVQS